MIGSQFTINKPFDHRQAMDMLFKVQDYLGSRGTASIRLFGDGTWGIATEGAYIALDDMRRLLTAETAKT